MSNSNQEVMRINLRRMQLWAFTEVGSPANDQEMHNRRRRIVRMFITALAVATLIAAPAFIQPAAARKADRDTCQSGWVERGYWRGCPLWQWYSGVQSAPGSGKGSCAADPRARRPMREREWWQG